VKKFALLCMIFVLVMIFFACASFHSADTEEQAGAGQYTDISHLQKKEIQQRTYDGIETAYFNKGDVNIAYPQISVEKIDRLIEKEASDIFFTYYAGEKENLTLRISYTVTLKTDEIFSICFYGYGDRKGAAHPNWNFYTLNINLKTGQKIFLSDVCNDIEELKRKIENKNFVFRMYDDKQTEEILKINELVDFDKLVGCDVQGSGEYSYFTEEGLGISFCIPHAIGDHAELEIPYAELDGVLNLKDDKPLVSDSSVYEICENQEGKELIFYSDDNYELFRKQYLELPDIERIDDNLYKIVYSTGVNCNYTVFIDVKKSKVTAPYFNLLFSNKDKVAFMENGTVFLSDIFDNGKVYAKIDREFSATAVPQSAVCYFELQNDTVYIEYLMGEKLEFIREQIRIG